MHVKQSNSYLYIVLANLNSGVTPFWFQALQILMDKNQLIFLTECHVLFSRAPAKVKTSMFANATKKLQHHHWQLDLKTFSAFQFTLIKSSFHIFLLHNEYVFPNLIKIKLSHMSQNSINYYGSRLCS